MEKKNSQKIVEQRAKKRSVVERGIIGLAVGVSELIPGMGGGTITYMVGIYEETMLSTEKIFNLRTPLRDRIYSI